MKALLIVIVLIFLFTLSVEASDWRIMPSSSNAFLFFVDVASIKHLESKIVRAWFKVINNPLSIKLPVRYTLIHQEFDCELERLRTLSVVRFDKEDNFISKSGSGESARWADIEPDTASKKTLCILCKPQ